MKKINEKTIGQIISLGIISGMRSTFALAIAAHYLSKQHNSALSNSRLRFIQSPVTAIIRELFSILLLSLSGYLQLRHILGS